MFDKPQRELVWFLDSCKTPRFGLNLGYTKDKVLIQLKDKPDFVEAVSFKNVLGVYR